MLCIYWANRHKYPTQDRKAFTISVVPNTSSKDILLNIQNIIDKVKRLTDKRKNILF